MYANMYDMLTLYIDSRKAKVAATSNRETLDVLLRVLTLWEESYGVTVEEECLRGLTSTRLQKWFNAMADSRKAATINHYVCLLNPFLRWAFAMGYTERDLSGILHTVRIPDVETLPEEERPMDKYLTHDQAEALLNAKAGRNRVRDRAIIALILYSGLRVSEVCSLTIGQMRNRTEPIVVKRKGGRYVPVVIGDGFWPYLDAYLERREDRDNDDAPLFMTSHGNPCDRYDIYRALSTKQKSLGVATGPHALRHTFVSEVENTCGAGVARDCANHKTLAITNRYDHTTREQRVAAVNSLHW